MYIVSLSLSLLQGEPLQAGRRRPRRSRQQTRCAGGLGGGAHGERDAPHAAGDVAAGVRGAAPREGGGRRGSRGRRGGASAVGHGGAGGGQVRGGRRARRGVRREGRRRGGRAAAGGAGGAAAGAAGGVLRGGHTCHILPFRPIL